MNLLPPEFGVVRSGGSVAVRGELDLAVEAQFTIAIDEALKVPAPALVVDLRELDFMDSCGIRCLVKAELACRAQGRRLVLVRPSAAVLRPLEVSGVVAQFVLADEPPATLDAAAA